MADDITNYTHYATNLTESKKYYWKVVAADGTGSVTSKLMNFTVLDTTAPITNITGGPPSSSNSYNATFNFTANEDDVTFKCKLDTGGWYSCSSPKTYYNLEDDKTHQFQVKATDSSGNEGEADAWIWTINDITAPNSTINSRPDSLTSLQNATFSFTSNEDDVTFECKLDGGYWSSCSSPKEYDDLSEGNHTFYVRATDDNENVGPVTSYSWQIDITAPVTTINSGPSNQTYSNSAQFSFSSNEDSSTFDCKLDYGYWFDCSSPKNFSSVEVGNHVFYVKATDLAGNEGEYDTWSWEVLENDIPELVNYNVNPNPAEYNQRVYFYSNFSDSDGYISQHYWSSSVDGFLSNSGNFSIDDLSVGDHTIIFRARDNIGAWSSNTTFEISIEQVVSVPELQNYSITPNPADYQERVYFYSNFSSNSGGLQLDKIYWNSSIDGVLAVGGPNQAGNFSTDELSSGLHAITLQAKNGNGWSLIYSFNLTINDPIIYPSMTITPSVALVGTIIEFSSFQDGPSPESIVWISDIDGNLSSQTSFGSGNLSVGNHVITLKYRFSGSSWSEMALPLLVFENIDLTFPYPTNSITLPNTFTWESAGDDLVYDFYLDKSCEGNNCDFRGSPSRLFYEGDYVWFGLRYENSSSIEKININTFERSVFITESSHISEIFDITINDGYLYSLSLPFINEVPNESYSYTKVCKWNLTTSDLVSCNDTDVVYGTAISHYEGELFILQSNYTISSSQKVVVLDSITLQEISNFSLYAPDLTSFEVSSDLDVDQNNGDIFISFRSHAGTVRSYNRTSDGDYQDYSFTTSGARYPTSITIRGNSFYVSGYYFSSYYGGLKSCNTVSLACDQIGYFDSSINRVGSIAVDENDRIFVVNSNIYTNIDYGTNKRIFISSLSNNMVGYDLLANSLYGEYELIASNLTETEFYLTKDFSYDRNSTYTWFVIGKKDDRLIFSEFREVWFVRAGPVVQEFSVTPRESNYGDRISFNINCTSEDGEIVSIIWNSSKDGFLSNSASFSTESLSPGDHLIIVFCYDETGLSANENDDISIYESNPESQKPVIQNYNAYPLSAGFSETISFFSNFTDLDGLVVVYEWSSSIDGLFGYEQYFSINNLSVGNHMITLRAQDNDGKWSDYTQFFVVINHRQGCTDPEAINYDYKATEENGSCEYQTEENITSIPDMSVGDYFYIHPHFNDFSGFMDDYTWDPSDGTILANYSNQGLAQMYSEGHKVIEARAQFDQYPLFRNNRQPTEVATFTNVSFVNNTEITINHAKFWWVGQDPDYEADCEWMFQVYKNGMVVGNATSQCLSNGDNLVSENYIINISLYVSLGDLIEIVVFYEGWENVMLHYGGEEFPSGFDISGLKPEAAEEEPDELACSFDTFMNNIYVNTNEYAGGAKEWQIGSASYHFVSEEIVYINWKTLQLTMDNLEPAPLTKLFTETSFDYENQVFTGKIDWEIEGTTQDDSAYWLYHLEFSEDYSYIAGGSVMFYDTNGVILGNYDFGALDQPFPVVYHYYALCTPSATDYFATHTPDEDLSSTEDANGGGEEVSFSLPENSMLYGVVAFTVMSLIGAGLVEMGARNSIPQIVEGLQNLLDAGITDSEINEALLNLENVDGLNYFSEDRANALELLNTYESTTGSALDSMNQLNELQNLVNELEEAGVSSPDLEAEIAEIESQITEQLAGDTNEDYSNSIWDNFRKRNN